MRLDAKPLKSPCCVGEAGGVDPVVVVRIAHRGLERGLIFWREFVENEFAHERLLVLIFFRRLGVRFREAFVDVFARFVELLFVMPFSGERRSKFDGFLREEGFDDVFDLIDEDGVVDVALQRPDAHANAP